MSRPRATVSISVDSYAFICRETEQIHALCNRAGVPEIIEGSTLTPAQRVAILEGAYRGLLKRVGVDPPLGAGDTEH